MANPVWFNETEGLNNKVDAERLVYSPKEGVKELTEAYNVDVGDRGNVSRRLGFEETDIVTECHSLFCDGGSCLFVTGDALSVLHSDLTATPIRNVTVGARMSYAQVGDVTYYVNGHEIGYVQNELSHVWSLPATTDYPDQTRVYSGPTVGTIVRHFASRIWIVVANTLVYSEPFKYSLFRPATNFVSFGSNINLVAVSVEGLFISTGQGIYYMSGAPPQTQIVRKTSYAAITGTDVQVDAHRLLGGKLGNNYLPMFTTDDGICLGLPNGDILNLTYDKLEYPKAAIGSAVYTGKKYIVSLEP